MLQRDAENREKMVACVKGAIRSERLPEMYQVGLMATDPDYQGRGLGSAVLHAMTQLVSTVTFIYSAISNDVVGRPRRSCLLANLKQCGQ